MMIRALSPEYQRATEQFLLPHLQSSMFLLSNLRTSGIVDGDAPFQGAYVGAFENDALVGVAAHYWNGNLMVQAGQRYALSAHLARAALETSGRPLNGLVGEGGNCASVLDAFGLQRSQFQLYETEGLYRLSIAQLRAPASAGTVRRALAADRDALVAMYRDYNIEALNMSDADAALADARRSVDSRCQRGHQFMLERHGEILAATAFNAIVSTYAQIGGVWTPPALRGKGYARAAVAGQLAIAASEGFTDAILFTGDENLPAIKSYQAIGFARVGDYFIGRLEAPWRLE